MASVFDKANQWLLTRIKENRERKHGRVLVEASGLQIVYPNTSLKIAWEEIAEVTAIRTPAYIGDNLSLLIRCNDGSLRKVMESDEAWRPLTEALQDHLPGSMPYAHWSLRTAFTEATGIVQVYQRT